MLIAPHFLDWLLVHLSILQNIKFSQIRHCINRGMSSKKRSPREWHIRQHCRPQLRRTKTLHKKNGTTRNLLIRETIPNSAAVHEMHVHWNPANSRGKPLFCSTALNSISHQWLQWCITNVRCKKLITPQRSHGETAPGQNLSRRKWSDRTREIASTSCTNEAVFRAAIAATVTKNVTHITQEWSRRKFHGKLENVFTAISEWNKQKKFYKLGIHNLEIFI